MKTLIKHSGRAPVKINFVPSTENPNLLKITRISDVSGKEHTMELPVTEDQLRNWLGDGQHSGHLIQHVMPHLSSEQREFLISGCTPEEWQKIVNEEV